MVHGIIPMEGNNICLKKGTPRQLTPMGIMLAELTILLHHLTMRDKEIGRGRDSGRDIPAIEATERFYFRLPLPLATVGLIERRDGRFPSFDAIRYDATVYLYKQNMFNDPETKEQRRLEGNGYCEGFEAFRTQNRIVS
jgi:hypothetical protein